MSENPDKPKSLCKIISDNKPDFFRGPSVKIQVQKSTTHGYGVFAIEDIEEGELIEESRMMRTGLRSNYTHDVVLRDYFWGLNKCTCDECREHGFVQFMGLGYLVLYNHQDQPNTKQKIEFDREVMTIIARRNISKGEEIFVTYGPKYWFFRKLWHKLSDDAKNQIFDSMNLSNP